ncbi:MAG: efflux RND transporter periplasmic adaptor subunit, partial [Xanthomonadales bacterium]|nr:efflux RND transporter periplasmic adaptor subunit [Xanthomonadales bacterium]
MDIKREDLKQKKRRRQIGFGLFGALALAAVIMLVARLEPAAPSVERASLWIDTVKRGELLREVRGPGTLVPTEIRWISAETSANVERILVKPGAQVEPDTVILELSNPEVMEQQLAANAALTAARADLEAKRVSLESQLLDQKANLASVEADYESARLQMDAEKELADKGIIPRIQYRRSELAANQRKVRLDIEQERIEKFRSTISSQLAADRARVEQLAGTAALRQRQVEALAVKAGISGVLQQVPVEEGQQVAPGRQLARVAKPDQLRAELRIPETQMKDVV